ncbi:MAG: flavodoxin family protein, partial [Candidatus Ranarchaeia archaeon]
MTKNNGESIKSLKDPISLVILNGSPREEACLFFANTAKETAEDFALSKIQPLEVHMINLGRLNFQMCKLCKACEDPQFLTEQGHRCVHNDILEEYYPILMEADAILMISPVYIGSVSAQVKIFWDRMRPIYPIWNSQPRVSQNIIVGGSRIGSQDRVITQAKAFLNTTWHVPLPDPNYSSGINAWSGYRFKRVETQYGSGLEG